MEEATIEFIEEKNDKKSSILLTLWKKREFQMAVDVCRFLLLIVAIVILIVLIKNIEQVKILGNDVCRLCEIKTGAVCFLPN